MKPAPAKAEATAHTRELDHELDRPQHDGVKHFLRVSRTQRLLFLPFVE